MYCFIEIFMYNFNYVLIRFSLIFYERMSMCLMNNVVTNEVDLFIEQLLTSLGFNKKHVGFFYIKFCLLFYIEKSAENTKQLSLTKIVYPACAKHFLCSSESVERCIRFSVKHCWLYGNLENQLNFFSNIKCSSIIPSVSTFFDAFLYHIIYWFGDAGIKV